MTGQMWEEGVYLYQSMGRGWVVLDGKEKIVFKTEQEARNYLDNKYKKHEQS